MSLHQPICDCEDALCQGDDPTYAYYVTVRDGGRTGFLLGPYATHQDARANVDRGRAYALGDCDGPDGRRIAYNGRAHFYAYGTSRLPRNVQAPRTVFGA